MLKDKQVVNKVKLDYEATSVSLMRRGAHVAVGGRDNKVHIYNHSSMNEVCVLSERDFITAVSFSNDDEHLAVADQAKNVKCYRLSSEGKYENVTRELWQHHAGKITCLAWSPDSNLLATASVDTHCFIYSPNKVTSHVQIKSE